MQYYLKVTKHKVYKKSPAEEAIKQVKKQGEMVACHLQKSLHVTKLKTSK